MSPVPVAALRLLSRDDVDDGVCTGFCGNSYVRWIIAILAVCGSIALLCLILAIAMKRVTGRWALGIPMRAQIRDPEGDNTVHSEFGRSRRPRRHRTQPDEADPVPAYHATPGLGDAGYYDADGNYVAHEPPPYVPPKAFLRTEEVELDNVTTNSEEVHASAESIGRGLIEEVPLPKHTRVPSQHANTS